MARFISLAALFLVVIAAILGSAAAQGGGIGGQVNDLQEALKKAAAAGAIPTDKLPGDIASAVGKGGGKTASAPSSTNSTSGRKLLAQSCLFAGAFDLCPFSSSPGAGPGTQCCEKGGSIIQSTSICIPNGLSCLCGFFFPSG